MSVGPQTFQVNCAGGLNLTATTSELFQNPGYATELINYESGINGGYRRINGFSKGGTDTQPSGTANPILGVFPYADGMIAVQYDGISNYNIYFSTDRITWVQVNKTMTYSTGLDSTALAAAAQTTRTTEGRVQFALLDGGTGHGEVIITDGVNNYAAFKITDPGGGRLYHYYEDATVADVTWCEVYKDRVIVANTNTVPNIVQWSDTYDVTTFTGANSGNIEMPSKVNGVKVWRDRLFVFGEKSIDEITSIFFGTTDINNVSVDNVSKNVGCIDGHSIQEVGGDIVFLSIDGLRTLSGTAKIDDIALTSVSRNIDPIIKEIVSQISIYDITSLVIRERNQYRLFYCRSANTDDKQSGVIGTLRIDPQTGGIRWEWSQIMGIPVSSGYSGVISGEEIIYHGGYDGYVYTHDDGGSFNSVNISARYQTPEIDYGSLARRDTLHWMKLSSKIEGNISDLKLKTTFNFGDTTQTINPPDIVLISGGDTSIYGEAIYGTDVYAGQTNTDSTTTLVGAGFSNKFLFYTNGTQDAYSIDSFLIKYHEGAVG